MGLMMLGRQIHTAELLAPELSASDVELAIEMLKNHKSPGTGQIPTDMIKAEGKKLAMRFINLLFLCGIRRNCLRSERSQS